MKLGSVDNSSLEAECLATCSQDPALLDNIEEHYTTSDKNGAREQVAGRRKLNYQQTLITLVVLLSSTQLLAEKTFISEQVNSNTASTTRVTNPTPLKRKGTCIVDVYGAPLALSKKIEQKYAKKVSYIERNLAEEFKNYNGNALDTRHVKELLEQKNVLKANIKKNEHVAFVDFQTVRYPDTKNIYTTIEIVQQNQSERLRFIAPQNTLPEDTPKHDLIEKMKKYQNKAMKLLMTHQIDLKDQTCPVYHCIVPFNHPQLKPYLTVFNKGVIQNKNKIIDALNHDTNPERRAGAAFLLGHLSNPHEIISLLSPHVTDPDDGVRNNVLRVIGETLMRSKITDVNALPFIALLDSPYVTDRNKALLVLLALADSKSGKKQIEQNHHGRLTNIANLKQPNNRDVAQMILNKIKA
ncbi:MAG: HEAT repeat domain-containing protein [Legionellaceae bacterium]|nr:HEAT repeat domain-containing protein [Legionellaceae bacterium]